MRKLPTSLTGIQGEGCPAPQPECRNALQFSTYVRPGGGRRAAGGGVPGCRGAGGRVVFGSCRNPVEKPHQMWGATGSVSTANGSKGNHAFREELPPCPATQRGHAQRRQRGRGAIDVLPLRSAPATDKGGWRRFRAGRGGCGSPHRGSALQRGGSRVGPGLRRRGWRGAAARGR
jgi:hypothetical protein